MNTISNADLALAVEYVAQRTVQDLAFMASIDDADDEVRAALSSEAASVGDIDFVTVIAEATLGNLVASGWPYEGNHLFKQIGDKHAFRYWYNIAFEAAVITAETWLKASPAERERLWETKRITTREQWELLTQDEKESRFDEYDALCRSEKEQEYADKRTDWLVAQVAENPSLSGCERDLMVWQLQQRGVDTGFAPIDLDMIHDDSRGW